MTRISPKETDKETDSTTAPRTPGDGAEHRVARGESVAASPPSSSGFTRVTVKRPEELSVDELATWSQLQNANSTLFSPFFRPEYVLAVGAVRSDVEVGVLSSGKQVVGFFPFQRSGRVAWPVGRRLSDYHGVISAPGLVANASRLVRACGLRNWHFDHVPASQTAFEPHALKSDVSPVLDLADGFDAYRGTLRPSSLDELKQTERKARKLQREVGPVRLEMHSDQPAMLDLLLQWKSDQYQRTQANDVFSYPWTVAALRKILECRSAEFAGLLSVLYAGPHPIALHLGMRSRHVLHWWFPTYNSDFAQYSPGRILLLELTRACASHGPRQIDLGRGLVDYKARAMSRAVPLLEGAVDRHPLARWLRASWWQAESWVRGSAMKSVLRVPGRLLRRLSDRQMFR